MKTSDDFKQFAAYADLLGEVRSIVEIGAFDLSDTLTLRRQWPKAEIACFEPDPRAVAAIHADVEKLDECDCWLFPVAVGSANGRARLFLSKSAEAGKKWTQSSSLRTPSTIHHAGSTPGGPCIFDGESVEVGVVTLDELHTIGQMAPIDLLWIDAQGFEDEILKGATETLKVTRFIFMEHNTDGMYLGAPTLDTLLALLPNWQVVKIFPHNVLLKHP